MLPVQQEVGSAPNIPPNEDAMERSSSTVVRSGAPVAQGKEAPTTALGAEVTPNATGDNQASADKPLLLACRATSDAKQEDRASQDGLGDVAESASSAPEHDQTSSSERKRDVQPSGESLMCPCGTSLEDPALATEGDQAGQTNPGYESYYIECATIGAAFGLVIGGPIGLVVGAASWAAASHTADGIGSYARTSGSEFRSYGAYMRTTFDTCLSEHETTWVNPAVFSCVGAE